MAFHEREYRAYILLGDPTCAPLWDWQRWFDFARAFDPVLRKCRDPAAVRVSQRSISGQQELKFGRLVWTVASFQKWTHGSPSTSGQCADWRFASVEASSPSLPRCGREGEPPDFFLTVSNEDTSYRDVPPQFNPRVFVAIAADLPDDALAASYTAVKKAEALIGSRLSGVISRPWGYSFGDFGGFQNAIQDIAHVGLFKIGDPHKRSVDLETLKEKWQTLK